VLFRRTDVVGRDPWCPARWGPGGVLSPLNTRIVNDAGVHVSTIEHLMAALAGTGVTNALVEIDGPEVPILDGSSALWAKAILRAGLRGLDAPQEAIEVLRPVEVRDGAAVARLEPYEGFAMTFAIDFPDEAIGQQSRELDLAGRSFLQVLCDSRTFCRAADLETMWSRGLALGGTPLNAVVVDGERVMTLAAGVTWTRPCATRCSTRWATWPRRGCRSWAATWGVRAGTRSPTGSCARCSRSRAPGGA
jgi:UDP-3-O-[3-hydroxymyristoyl] N-acetylglucosamine deacetylase